LASDALLTTLHPLLENVLQTVDHLEISCLGAPFSWLEKSRNRMGLDLDCMADVLMGFHGYIFSKPNTEFNSYAILEKWVECCKKCIACLGRYFEKETVTASPQSPDSDY
jgi:hypothetical protein